MNYPAATTTVTLSRPVDLNGETITSLTVREPTVRDKIMFEKAKGDPMEKELAMIASLCGRAPQDLYGLPSYDYDQLVLAFNNFLLPPEERQSNS
ncbi:phage tail assembly protein [Mixta calida]|uniref:phage tail assembly protein n=1 Tax=Mixta calida TaxID=665913 RepID=UPI0028B2065A|nr:phage tail assembly protein [Mixta calida]